MLDIRQQLMCPGGVESVAFRVVSSVRSPCTADWSATCDGDVIGLVSMSAEPGLVTIGVSEDLSRHGSVSGPAAADVVVS